jgi:formylglycine-generating enzyme required for sulfatase activity
VVLELKRSAEHDQLIMSDGQSRVGAVLNDSFQLHTSHGPITIPTTRLAALDLTRQSSGIEAIVSVAGDRLSGFLVETNLIFRPAGEAEADSFRRESISKVVFRLRTDEATDLRQHHLIVLRNGDFCTGRLQPGELAFTTAGGGPRRFRVETTESIRLPPTPGASARVEFGSGEAWEGTLSPTDLEIELDVGFKLRVYSDRLTLVRRWTGWSADLAERIGVPAVTLHAAPNSAGAVGAELVWIPPGEFVLGSPPEEKDRDLDEGPTTRVVMAAGFWIAPREVTQAEYQLVTGRNPSQYTGDDQRPVEKVSWQDAVDYCIARTRREQASGRLPEGYAYRLPTEAEWEYACRAGTTTRFSYGDDPSYLQAGDYAWCNRNSDSTTHPVGTRRPNPWGLFDMHGNVWEWCLDSWGGAYPGGTVTNAVRLPDGSLRVARGGSWLYEARFCRSANRDSYGMLNRCSDLGFRVVLTPVGTGPTPRGRTEPP